MAESGLLLALRDFDLVRVDCGELVGDELKRVSLTLRSEEKKRLPPASFPLERWAASLRRRASSFTSSSVPRCSLKSLRLSTKHTVSLMALTVALRRSLLSSDISPKKLPLSSVATWM